MNTIVFNQVESEKLIIMAVYKAPIPREFNQNSCIMCP